MIKIDTNNPGWIKAWVAVCEDPWGLVVCQTQEDAQEKAMQLGTAYQVKYGSFRVGTTDFMWINFEND